MADEELNVRQNVISKTLQEVQATTTPTDTDPDPCVICLDTVSEKAIAYPCRHDSFDFICLVSWLQENDTCPLCKSIVKNVNYDLQSRHGPKRYTHSKVEKASRQVHSQGRARRDLYRQRQRNGRTLSQAPSIDEALARRRIVYTRKMFSLHVGANRISQYKDFTPESLSQNERLLKRAKMWIRRELQVFEFLNQDSAGDNATQRRANNAEFLLEYIVAILKTVDLRGSKGQAEDLIAEFLGKEHTRLFIHELQAWLRSPYEMLEDWDRAVQYASETVIR
ncbi:putative ring finger domain protein [Phaeomoniella chlamydospora]|uniref:RING-type E3 ubiquitin transferase n=1 Tax=Phaeomoniella chlamydospora TaxID=158046 RepID=A0A0G2HFT9_PHACM|nr:putative ring finger domain protein [Phaeomoniella chlamydospora]